MKNLLTYFVESVEATLLLLEIDLDTLHAGRTLIAELGTERRTVRVRNHKVADFRLTLTIIIFCLFYKLCY